ncbi:sterile alpha and TIR motif-containing protein 1 [Trichogramma pretiosum]|uniref:sterile alpha and TIR motif-containing protein 1 n=1 Tax=Trichogramma pretiosum TaxID=7493 RepID=UPI0006C96FEF|nr:sterile alpha and TIR motif-containing protein 1 [Trichogramma pretiosum]XP_014221126.1 sterile alpha and TIR motif-containing protein 1 [Trichogramma pretiosum]XP_014221129.1 sterile alpha and TIR motif-containing protein 1 [Trichogramma pretiosum]XP_023314253.1 sterile alpha and TIR motif-containing protein 1 [Trichogramma pretiosum]XP_023314254.1 sterile alpha and TIR motif-containing protein 1 [Trichogramma pretiosum]
MFTSSDHCIRKKECKTLADSISKRQRARIKNQLSELQHEIHIMENSQQKSIEDIDDENTQCEILEIDPSESSHSNVEPKIHCVLAKNYPDQLSNCNLDEISKSSVNSIPENLPILESIKYEQKKVTTASSAKLITGGFSTKSDGSKVKEKEDLKLDDACYSKKSNTFARRTSEEQNKTIEESCLYAEKKSLETQQQRQALTKKGIFKHATHSTSSQSTITVASKATIAPSMQISNELNDKNYSIHPNIKPSIDCKGDAPQKTLDDIDKLTSKSKSQEIELVKKKYSDFIENLVNRLKDDKENRINLNDATKSFFVDQINDIIQKSWAVPTHGHELGLSLCDSLRTNGGLNLLIDNCISNDDRLQFSSARLLEQCLTTDNREHIVDSGLDKVVNAACMCTKRINSVEHARVGTGILEHLFKHNENTCSDVIRLGGLDAVLFECRKNDVETLRHCAGALANLSLYGGADNQEAMIKRKVPMWLFPLAFHNDDNIKYYACLAIAVLVANKEIEAAVLKSGTLNLVEPFVTSHIPYNFAKSNLAYAHGQSENWLLRLVPVLNSKREEARNLAAFHFCMEAGIKKQQGKTSIFRKIGAIEPLKKVAGCPNAIASKLAAHALKLMGEEVPHKLSQQVPLWSTKDVLEWIKQIGFEHFITSFVESQVDGDLLLSITDEHLKEDIGMSNGILRQRFTRELHNLKRITDYSSRDTGNLNSFLQSIGQEFSIYTYTMLNAGVDKDTIKTLTEDQLLTECHITNSIHRLRILEAIKNCNANQFITSANEESDKSLDVFVSYRRSNGSQLASLLKVHLQLRGFSVFIDVERLEAGKFDNNLLQSIRQAKHFLLVLTPKALERCVNDTDCKDWVHREVVAALQSQCNIIPIIDNFQWPEPEDLPDDMRAVCHFNGVRWIHDYQDACVDKLERFMRGELPVKSE